LLNNDQAWIDVEYLSDAASGLGSFASSGKSDLLAAVAAYSADGASWNSSPAGTPFSMSVTFTPAQVAHARTSRCMMASIAAAMVARNW
jgi:hypothetical protein